MPTHAEKRLLPYSAEEMYDLIAGIDRYPEFLPWCSAARIRSRRAEGAREIVEADLVISFRVFRERFGSRVVLDPGRMRIETEYLDGPFKFMRSTWDFRDRPEGGCEVEFLVDFEMRNAVLQKVVGVVFQEAMLRIVRAFESRAAQLYAAGA